MRLFLSFIFAIFAPFASADRLTPIIGSTLMVGWPGTSLSNDSTQLLCRQLAAGQVGGVLFLAHNMQSPDQVAELTQFFARCGARFQPLLAVDQEGGVVDRIGRLPGENRTPSAQDLGTGSATTAEQIYQGMAERVRDLGFNVNFGPVADLNTNTNNPIIGRLERSYGTGTITPYLQAFIDPHADRGISTALKHFPGHGSSTTDSHRGFTDVTDTWQTSELSPFALGVGLSGDSAVMAGHLVHRGLDSSGLPASLSREMLQGVLRDQLGFDGAIVSDDMEMRAITDTYGFASSVKLGLSAGLDLFIYGNGGPYRAGSVDAYHAAVRAALEEGLLSEADLRAKQARLNAWKD